HHPVPSDRNDADSLYAIGNYQQAIPLLKNQGRFYKVAKSYQVLGHFQKAHHFYQKALSGKEKNPLVLFDYAKLLTKTSDYDEADSLLKILHQSYPKNANFVYRRALIKEKQDDPKALSLYLEVYKLNENNFKAAYKVARIYVQAHQFEKAKPLIEKGLKANPGSKRFLILSGAIQFYTGKYDKAITTYTHLLDLGYVYAEFYDKLGKAYRHADQFDEALKQYGILQEKFPEKSPTKWEHNIALVYQKMGYPKKAKIHFEKAISRLKLPVAEAYLSLADLYKEKGDYARQLKILHKALDRAPRHEEVLLALAVAADNYYADRKMVLRYYQNYLKYYGETGRLRKFAKTRALHLKKE